MSKSLYEEALADAAKLREIAEANATHAVIESIKPRIKKLVETELMGLDDFGGAEGPGVDAFDQEIETAANAEVSNEVPAIASNPAVKPPRSSSAPQAATKAPVEPTVAPVDDTMVSQEPPVDVVAVTGDNTDQIVVDDVDAVPGVSDKVTLDLDSLEATGEPDEDEMYELDLEAADLLASLKKAGTGKDLVSEQQLIKRIALNKLTIQKLESAPAYKQGSRSTAHKIARLIESVEHMYGYVQEMLAGSKNKQEIETKLEEQFSRLTKLQEQRENMKKKLVNEEDLTLKLTGLPELDDEALENVGVDLVAGDEEEELSVDGDGDTDDMGDVDAEGGDEDLDFDFGGDDMDDDMAESHMIEFDAKELQAEVRKMRKRALQEETKPQSWGHGVDAKAEENFGGGKSEGDPFEDGEVTTEGDESCSGDEMEEADDTMNQLQNRRKKDEKGDNVADQHDSMAENKTGRKNGSVKESAGTQKLRNELAAANLLNAKLAYTTKLLQMEALSKRQKAAVVERLEEATSVRDCKLIYESLVRALNKSTVSEGFRRPVGSSSAVVRSSGASVISESYETSRWAKLAGIKKD